MILKNYGELVRWFDDMAKHNFELRRYEKVSLSKLGMDYREELLKHASAFEKDPSNFTFHHIRLLFVSLNKEPIRYPLVGTLMNGRCRIDPGGSRLMVAKYLGLDHAPVDVICPKNFLIDYNGPMEKISNVDQFQSVYRECSGAAYVQTCRNNANTPYYDSDVWDGEFWYQMNYDDPKHFAKDDTSAWLKNNQHIRCKDPIEYYFL